jgi:hypothetical protein
LIAAEQGHDQEEEVGTDEHDVEVVLISELLEE